MPTYLYECLETGRQYEVDQRITEPAHTWRDHEKGTWGDGKAPRGAFEVKRLIAGAPSFALIAGDSGGWASQGYSKPEHARKAEQTLGRKLHKNNG